MGTAMKMFFDSTIEVFFLCFLSVFCGSRIASKLGRHIHL